MLCTENVLKTFITRVITKVITKVWTGPSNAVTAGNVVNIYDREDKAARCKFVTVRVRWPPEEPQTSGT